MRKEGSFRLMHSFPFSSHFSVIEHLFLLCNASPDLKLYSVCNRASPHLIFGPVLTLWNNKNIRFQHVCLFSLFVFPFLLPLPSPVRPLVFFSPLTKLIAAVYFGAFLPAWSGCCRQCGKWCASMSYTGSVTEWARSTQKASNPLH